ncbi:MAG: SURF1 family protein [Stenotrophobium sp.]
MLRARTAAALMQRGRFQTSAVSIGVVLLTTAILVALGFWQIQRGHEKRDLLIRYAAAIAQPAVALDPQQPARAEVIHVRAQGRYDTQRQLLLDNRVNHDRPGYEVWTPLRLTGGALVMVNRGWIPRPMAGQPLPHLTAPDGTVDVDGYWREFPRPGLRLGGTPPCTAAARFPAVVNYPRRHDLACLLGAPVASGLLLLNATAPGGYVREWDFNNGFPPVRHYAYAAQWFALALTLLFLFIKLSLKRTDD